MRSFANPLSVLCVKNLCRLLHQLGLTKPLKDRVKLIRRSASKITPSLTVGLPHDSVRATISLRTDRARGGPVCITDALESHIEDADGVFTGHDPIADLVPGAILDHCGVADREWSRMDFPDEAIGGRLERKISDVALRV